MISVFFIACGKDLTTDGINKTGKKLSRVGDTEFTYENNLLSEVQNERGYYVLQKYFYNNLDQVIEINYYIEDESGNLKLQEKELLSYDNNVLLSSRRQRVNADLTFSDIYYYNYFYDSNNKLIKSDYINATTNEVENSTEYEWSNGNISKKINLIENNMILSTAEFEYDDKLSYKFCSPYYRAYGENLSKNNATKITYTSNSDLIIIDFICEVCTLKYEYDGYLPTSVERMFFGKSEIEYE